MLATYKARLRGNQLEWVDDVPTEIAEADELTVEVTVFTAASADSSTKSRGQRMAEALEQLAKANEVSEIVDPPAWQQEMRKERVLPGREE